MTKKHLVLITMILLALTLTFVLSGCAGTEDELKGKNIVVFELNGGTLEFKTSSVSTKINFAYHPGTYIVDPAEIPGYKIYKNEFVFTGWYTSPECNPGEKWDFASRTFDTESLTLYAGWEKAIQYTYTVYYVDGDVDVELGRYPVSAGEKFDDWLKYAESRKDYTPTGFFSDRQLTTPWDENTVHPGGESDLHIPVYVDYIEGSWSLVNDYTGLVNAVKNGKNVYLTENIDCLGEELYFSNPYSGILEGNGYSVSNFKIKMSGALIMPTYALFSGLEEGSEIRNVNFENVTYEMFGIPENVRKIKISALAKSANGTTVSNVTVTGKLLTDYEGELPTLLQPFYEEDSFGDVSGFTAVITVEKQAQ